MKLGELPIGTIVELRGAGQFMILPKSNLLEGAPPLNYPDRIPLLSLTNLHVGWASTENYSFTIISNN